MLAAFVMITCSSVSFGKNGPDDKPSHQAGDDKGADAAKKQANDQKKGNDNAPADDHGVDVLPEVHGPGHK